MKIHSVRLKNFAGVSEREVNFAATGVTVIEGPNEIGKSSLFQALDLLLDHLDSSSRREVERAKPVHLDAGAEVEAELEVGNFRFTYMKRFHRDRETRLTIHSPRPENLTGRTAHDRVKQILETSMDAALWKALRIVQGEGVDLPDLKGQPALAQALNLAAGGVQVDDNQQALLDTARSEYLRYWTEGGREKRDPIGIARQAETDAKTQFEERRTQLASLESDIESYTKLSLEVNPAQESVRETATSLASLEREWATVSKLADKVKLLRAEHGKAQAELEAATEADRERKRLIEATTRQAETIQIRAEAEAKSKSQQETAQRRFHTARERRDKAQQALDEAEIELKLRRADFEFRDNELDLEQMSERLGRIEEAEEAARSAESLIATSDITSELHDAIRSADIQVREAQALLNAASPTVTVKALSDVPILLNGDHLTIGSGESRTTPAAEPVTLRVGDGAEIAVAPGTGEADLKQGLVDAQRTLVGLLNKAGVANLGEAEKALAARVDAERTIRERDRIVEQNRRDLTREDLERRIRQLQSSVGAYKQRRLTAPELPRDRDQASEWLTAADETAEMQRPILDQAKVEYDAARAASEGANQQAAVDQALAKQAREESERAQSQLLVARENLSDGNVTRRQQTAHEAADAALKKLDAAEKELDEADPVGVEKRRTTARAANETARDRLNAVQGDLAGLRARLDALGEQGLAESVAAAEKLSLDSFETLARLMRRANAAKLLYETLAAERDAAQQQYVAPLHDRIAELGKYVFGQSFDIEIDDQLEVVTRTLNGITLPYVSLSTGAREQIGLLMRLAAAMLADDSGGVPLVLDDTLGSTDRSRLEGVGVATSVAARSCQIILLTSMPERYQHIDTAKSVRLF